MILSRNSSCSGWPMSASRAVVASSSARPRSARSGHSALARAKRVSAVTTAELWCFVRIDSARSSSLRAPVLSPSSTAHSPRLVSGNARCGCSLSRLASRIVKTSCQCSLACSQSPVRSLITSPRLKSGNATEAWVAPRFDFARRTVCRALRRRRDCHRETRYWPSC